MRRGPGRPLHRDDRDDRIRERRGWATRVLLVVLLALGLRLLTAGHGVMTVDEPTWLSRSAGFAKALGEGDFDRARASTPPRLATRPGITTMWIGAGARGVGYALTGAGVTDRPLRPVESSPFALQLSQILMAVVSAGLIGAIVALGRPVLGPGAATAAGVLLAVEPWLIAHNSVLHTDGLVTLTLAAATLALLVALGWGRDGPGGAGTSTRHALAAGAFFALAVLTKLNALLFGPGLTVLVVVTLVVAGRRRPADDGSPPAKGPTRRGVLAVVGLVGAAAVACFVVPYPSLWSDPGDELGALRRTAELGDTGGVQFFAGRRTLDPGALFYPVNLAVRASPWLLVLAAAAVLLAVRRRLPWAVVATLALVPVPYVVAATLAAKKFDRYVLPVLPFLAMLGGLAVAWLWDRLVEARLEWAPRIVLAGLLVAALALPSLAWSPDTMAYVNPVTGGQGRAERNVLLGWGEGMERFGRRIQAEEGGRCDDVVVAVGFYTGRAVLPCGRLRPLDIHRAADLEGFDYVILYPLYTQRDVGGADLPEVVRRNGSLVMSLRLGGVDYGALYRVG